LDGGRADGIFRREPVDTCIGKLRVEGQQVPEYGAGVTRAGEPVGTLTSPADSPRFGVIGIAMLDAAHAVDGTALEVDLGDGTVPATVAELSVYDPQKRRPRA
jgi:glycine cleavage system aminomethyltransferase T